MASVKCSYETREMDNSKCGTYKAPKLKVASTGFDYVEIRKPNSKQRQVDSTFEQDQPDTYY